MHTARRPMPTRPGTLLVVLFAALATACGGSESSGAPSGPSAPVAPVPTQSTAGVVYVRTDSVPYVPSFTPSTPLPNARVSLAGTVAVAGTDGAFTLQTSVSATKTAVPLTVSLTGYQDASLPWLYAEIGQPVAIGMYREVPVTARPGFLKGVTLMDEGGWLPGMLREGLLAPTLDRIQSTVGANLVQYIDQMFITQVNATTNAVTIVPDVWGMGTREMYVPMVAAAKARGMQFMMEIGLSPGGPEANDIGLIDKNNTALWDAFFAAWRPLVLERATIARDLGVEYLSLGHNLGYLSRTDVARWRSLIASIRGVGYTGKITYFANVGHLLFDPTQWVTEWTTVDPAFAGLFDLLGVNIYDPVAKVSATEVLDRAQTRTRMRTGFAALMAKLASQPKPLLIQVATPSVFGGVINSEYIEPCNTASCNSVANQRTRVYQQQADVYQAVFETINGSAQGNGRPLGLTTWGYHFRDDPLMGLGHGDAAFDKSASVRGKPAEYVMKWWYQRL